jgi:glutathione S-transferase
MKLYYFDLTGRAEPIRLLLTHAGVKFQDIRIPFKDWPQMKGKFELGQLPVLEVNGQKYCQSMAILEFLSAKYGYTPENFGLFSKAIFAMNTLDDLMSKVFPVVSSVSTLNEEDKAAAIKEIIEKHGPLYIGAIEKLYKENPCKDYLVGNKYSLGDFYLLGAYRTLVADENFRKPFFDKFVEKHPDLNAYLAKCLKDFAYYYGEDKFKVYYFDIAGRAEMIRMLLKYVKAPFEDIRIKMDDWPKEKTSGKFELQQVPMLECEATETRICQTDAIMHWLGRRFNLMPKKPEKFYKLLWWTNTAKDIINGTMKIYLPIPEEKKKEIMQAFFEKSVPVFFGRNGE